MDKSGWAKTASRSGKFFGACDYPCERFHHLPLTVAFLPLCRCFSLSFFRIRLVFFGSIIILFFFFFCLFFQAQAKLNTKYDGWHREILHSFGQKVAGRSEGFYKQLHALLNELEQQGRAEDPTETSMDAMTFLSMSRFQMEALISGVGSHADDLLSSLVQNLTQFLLKLQEASKADIEWDATVESLRASERLLERQRFAFPTDWLWIDKVEGELETLQQLLRHQVLLVEQNREQIVDMVKRFNERVQYRLKELYSDWMTQRPVSSDVSPQHASQVLTRYEQRLASLSSQFHAGKKAKDVLGLENDDVDGEQQQFTPQALEEEINDMKGVWNALGTLFNDVATLRDTLWAALVPKKVRQQLEELLEKIKKIPSRFRQYDAFEEMRTHITAYLKLNMLITDLRTDALKERHWKSIMGILKIKKSLHDVTLGTLWGKAKPPPPLLALSQAHPSFVNIWRAIDIYLY